MRYDFHAHEDLTFEVDTIVVVPLFFLLVNEGWVKSCIEGISMAAKVIDQNIYPTKRVQGFFDDAFDLRVVRYVSFQCN